MAEGESALSEQPEAVVNHQAPVEVVVAKFQNLLTVALAMLSQAHLIVLKRFHAKFLELALAKPRDQHLCSPLLTEILDADRAAWTAVIELRALHLISITMFGMDHVFFVRARCLSAGLQSSVLLADQRGIEPPPAIC